VSNINIRTFGKDDDQPSSVELNEIGDGARSLLRPSFAGNLQGTRSPAGLLISSNPTLPILATLSGASSPYSWTEFGGSRSGTSNAYEINGVSGLSGRKYALFVGPGLMYFQDIRGGTPAPTTGVICGGCGGAAMPTTVNIAISTVGPSPYPFTSTCTASPGAPFQDVTLTWQTAPAGFPAYAVTGGKAMLVVHPSSYAYFVACFSFSDPSTGVPLHAWRHSRWHVSLGEEVLYEWSMAGVGGNTCSPFFFQNGRVIKSGCVSTTTGSYIVVTMTG
jgi:hypothetical protein